MAKKNGPANGQSRLEEAMAMLIQNQAAFVSSLREPDRLHARFERESAKRFARIEAQMAQIISVLNEHGRLIEALPEAVREKSGFKTQ